MGAIHLRLQDQPSANTQALHRSIHQQQPNYPGKSRVRGLRVLVNCLYANLCPRPGSFMRRGIIVSELAIADTWTSPTSNDRGIPPTSRNNPRPGYPRVPSSRQRTIVMIRTPGTHYPGTQTSARSALLRLTNNNTKCTAKAVSKRDQQWDCKRSLAPAPGYPGYRRGDTGRTLGTRVPRVPRVPAR
eukprot:636975-Rhodomonas_salina.1